MARPLRLEFPGALYHITSRGDRREAIYENPNDMAMFIELLGEVCERYNWVIYAYCLMTNHYHLLVETPEANLSKGMRQLNGVYTKRFNVAHKRVGHVFQGRYKAIFVQAESYLLELCRYIVLNPVRAGMVSDVADWRWSSYEQTVDINRLNDFKWLSIDTVLSRFGETKKTAILRYMDFVRAGIGLSLIWDQLKNQVYLGDDVFVSNLVAQLERQDTLVEVPSIQRRPMAKPLAHYAESASTRNAAIVNAYASGGYSMKQIADYFNLHYSSVSRAVKNARCNS